MPRRMRGEGAVFQRCDAPSCPPLVDGPPGKNGQPTKVRPVHTCRGTWVGRLDVAVINKKRKQRVVYGKTQREAITKLQKARKQVDKGVLVTRSVRLEDWLDHWLDKVCPSKQRMKPKTLATYRSYVERYLKPAIGRVKLDRLTTQHVRDLHAYVLSQPGRNGGGLSATTAGHAHRILGTALADAMREDLVERNVAALESAPVDEKRQRRPLSWGEFGRFMRVVEHDRLASRWLFGFLTASRQGETLGLGWDSVDFESGTVDLATQLQRIPYKHGCGSKTGETWPCGRKGADRCPNRALDVRPGFWYQQLDGNLCLQRPKTKGSTRLVPLPGPVIDALRVRESAYLGERERYAYRHGCGERRGDLKPCGEKQADRCPHRELADHGLVWARPDGRPIDGSDDRAQWHGHLEAAGIAGTDQHSMRHTTSTLLLKLNVPEHVRMSILGHSEEATNRRYTHVDLTLQQEAMRLLGEAARKALTSASEG